MEKVIVLIRLGVFLLLMGSVVMVQRFWFVSAWRRIQEISRPVVRQLFQTVWVAALVLLLTTVLDSFFGHFIPRRGGVWLIATSRLWLFASFFAFLAFQFVRALGWVSLLTSKLFGAKMADFDPARRDFFRYVAYAAGSVPLLAATYGFAAARFRYQVHKVEVPVANLPKALDGTKIVQLSDIHAGDFMPVDEIRRAVEMANDLSADMAVITGDFISGRNDPLAQCIAELSRLHAPLGTWGCNGNHEIYADAEEAARLHFEHHGMRLLRQESVQLEHHGEKFNLIGVDYQRDHMTRQHSTGPMLQSIEHLVSRSMPNILLSHNPNSFRRAAELGIELSLAGHTHGGQVKFEIVDHDITPARLITDFVAGRYDLPMKHSNSSDTNGTAVKSAALYVNRGLGTFGMPVRLGVPPEITLLTLRSA